MDKETKVVVEQSLLDIAIQQCGDARAVFDIAVLNDLSITAELEVGQVVQSNTVFDMAIAKYYKERDLKPTTALGLKDKEVINKPEGISYWAIGVDFIVQ